MRHFTYIARFSVTLLALGWLLAACTTGQSTPLFPAPTVDEVTIDGDTITITGSNFFQVHPGSTLPSNLTVSVCGSIVGNLNLNGETKTVTFAPGNIATITTATKLVGTISNAQTFAHAGVQITNPDGQSLNIDIDCEPSTEPELEPGTYLQVTVDFDVANNSDAIFEPDALGDDWEYLTTYFLPLVGTGEITVDWGDGHSSTIVNPDASNYEAHEPLTHTYDVGGRYIVTVTGSLSDATFGGFFDVENGWDSCFMDDLEEYCEETSYDDPFDGDEDALMRYQFGRYLTMVSFDAWGPFEYRDLAGAFFFMVNLESVPDHLPDGVTNLEGMFYEAYSFDGDISNWDTSSVHYMYAMFQHATSFNQDIGGWDVGNVASMHYMFQGATSFNQDISSWDVRNVMYMGFMFDGAESFNQDLDAWETNSLTSIWGIFRDATAFNGKIGTWDVSDVWDFDEAFSGATMFNQDIGDWNVENGTYAGSMFYNATSFNQDLSGWCFVNLSAAPSNFNLNSPFASNSAYQPQWACTLD